MTGKKLSANTLPHIIHLVSITWWMRPGLSHFSLLFFYFCILLDSKTGRPGNETVTYMHQYTVISSTEMTGHEIQRFIIWNFEYGKHYSGPEYAVKPLNHCKLIPQSAHSLIPHSASCPSFKHDTFIFPSLSLFQWPSTFTVMTITGYTTIYTIPLQV